MASILDITLSDDENPGGIDSEDSDDGFKVCDNFTKEPPKKKFWKESGESSTAEPEIRPKKGVLQASGATTTPLVAHFFESVFGTQMADLRNQPKGCGKCQACKSVDCGSCSQCLSKKKFGGDIEDKKNNLR